MTSRSMWTKYNYLWVTLVFFLFSLLGHWLFAWFAYVDEQQAHREPVEATQFLIATSRDMLENWQSEFLQLIWQVCGLAYFVYCGSPQSKEGDERKEEKLDAILRRLDPDHADTLLRTLDQKYPRS